MKRCVSNANSISRYFMNSGAIFWFCSPQLTYRDGESSDTVVTGFAVFMRFESSYCVHSPCETVQSPRLVLAYGILPRWGVFRIR